MGRKLEPELIEYFERKLENNGIYELALENKLPRIIMVEAAKTLVGNKEKGFNRGKIIELVQATTGNKPPDAYCMSTVMSCIAFAELKLGIKSHLKSSASCASVFSACDEQYYVKNIPAAGAVAIWGRYDSSNNSSNNGKYLGGHTGIVISADDEYAWLVEGNTSSSLNGNDEIISDGQGIHFTKRKLYPNGSFKLRKYLKPF